MTGADTTPQIAASDLKVKQEASDSGHFEKSVPDPAHEKWLLESIDHVFKELKDLTDGRKMVASMGGCSGALLGKLASLLGCSDGSSGPHVLSEAELRYALGDPILDMLSNCWGFKVTHFLVNNFAKATLPFPNRLGLRSKWTRSCPQKWKRARPNEAHAQA